MAEIRNIGGNGGEVRKLTNNQIPENDVPPVTKANIQTDGVKIPVGAPGELGQPTGLPAPPLAPGKKLLPDAITGREASQLKSAEQLSATAGASATDKLLGLDQKPTILGALPAPPGNTEILRHLTPAMRRNIMRNMLAKQREKMKRLARFLRRERETLDSENESFQNEPEERESFYEALAENSNALAIDETQVTRATEELGKTARMLDVLDEMLAMQDYTISQIGTFSQG